MINVYLLLDCPATASSHRSAVPNRRERLPGVTPSRSSPPAILFSHLRRFPAWFFCCHGFSLNNMAVSLNSDIKAAKWGLSFRINNVAA